MKISEKFEKFLRFFLTIILIIIVYYFFKNLGIINLLIKVLSALIPLYIAIFISWLLLPIANFIKQKLNINYFLASLIAIIGFFLITIILLFVIAPQIFIELKNFITVLPETLAQWKHQLLTNQPQLMQFIDSINPYTDLNIITEDIITFLKNNSHLVTDKLEIIIHYLCKSIEIIIQIIIGFFLTIYLMPNLEHFKNLLIRLIPKTQQNNISQIIHNISIKLHGYLKAIGLDMLSVSIILSICNIIFFSSNIPIHTCIIIAIIAGIFNCIAYIGPVIGSIPLVITVTQYYGFSGLLLSILIIAITQLIESHFIYPFILGQSIKIKPISILVFLLISSTIFGFVGLFISMPLLIIIKTILVQYKIINDDDI